MTTDTADTPRPVEPLVIWPVQCSCGHLFLEKYQWKQVNERGEIGFCWCGFCRTRLPVKPYNAAVERRPESGDDKT